MVAPLPHSTLARGGLSLYDNLHDPNDPTPPATISAAPVLYKEQEPSVQAIQDSASLPDPALRFQPQIRRPIVKQAKSKPTFPKGVSILTTAPVTASAVNSAAPEAPNTQKTSLADWTATKDDEIIYGAGEKPQRGGRKKRKKKRQQDEPEAIDWDEIYDPAKPTDIQKYHTSNDKISEIREWKALLYGLSQRRNHSESSSDEEYSSNNPSRSGFAPLPAHSFAPPPPSPPIPAPDEIAVGDTFDRRRIITPIQPTSCHSVPSPQSPLHSSHRSPSPSTTAVPGSTVICREPVMYKRSLDSEDKEKADDPDLYKPSLSGPNSHEAVESGRSKVPGQTGFTQRLMSKYGWSKGTGLGADESGIVNPLRVQVEKRRKKADAAGGGWAEPGGKGKILGGKRKGEEGKFGKMSEVIVLCNMLENMPDLHQEILQGLGQEIGEECSEKYGHVERLYIEQETRQVFIKFTDQVSALRAVNELDGRVFNGNSIVPKFYNADKFEQGVYTLT